MEAEGMPGPAQSLRRCVAKLDAHEGGGPEPAQPPALAAPAKEPERKKAK
jgi:hypothetical protein